MTSIRLVSTDEKHTLSPNGRKIFLDRYALKDGDRSLLKLSVNQIVIVTPNPEVASREIALVKRTYVDSKLGAMVEVSFEDDPSKTQTFRLDEIDVPIETEPRKMHKRVAGAIASIEDEAQQESRFSEFLALLGDFRMIPGGRVLASAGTGVETTCYNCFVLPAPHDSRNMLKYRNAGTPTDDWLLQDGIDETLSRMTEIMSRGGGVGIPINTLRPRDAYVKGVNGRSSGSVSWAEEYSRRTGKIEQGGSRRGALIVIQAIWHPDIEQFINAKRNADFANNCNMSVAVTDAFMKAVEDDGEWSLVFPDTTFEKYDPEWDGDIEVWREKNYPIKIYKTLKARDLWKMICDSAHASAEPGLFFIDRYNKMSNTWYYREGRIWCTNPCGEEGIPGNAVCNLLHMFLVRYAMDRKTEFTYTVDDETAFTCNGVDLSSLAEDVATAVRFGDNVIDYTYYFDPRNREQQMNERRVGLGTLGLGELLMRLRIEYGSEESLEAMDAIYGTITCAAYNASVDLAIERGSFPWLDKEKFLESGFMKTMPKSIRDRIREHGIRNATLVTEAPTGTIGTKVQTSTGIEPFPFLAWKRNSRLGTLVEMPIPFREYWEENWGSVDDLLKQDDVNEYLSRLWKDGMLPKHFVTASWMTPETHAKTQAAVQRWTDSSISKTSNLPEHYTPEQVGEYYQLIYNLGCKGGTVYRQGSRQEAVLEGIKKEKKQEPEYDLRPVEADVGPALWAKTKTSVGTAHTFMRLDDAKKPMDIFNLCGKTGTEVMADQEAIGRLMSMCMRMNSPIDQIRRLELMSESLHGIGGAESVGFGENRVTSIADGVAHNIDKLISATQEKKFNGNGKHKDLCPKCHSASLEKGAGCATCLSCGFSKC